MWICFCHQRLKKKKKLHQERCIFAYKQAPRKKESTAFQQEPRADWSLWPERQLQSPNQEQQETETGHVLRFVWWHRTHAVGFVAHPEHKSPPTVLFFVTHDALVCRVASTAEETWLQTTRDRHMHPSVDLCVCLGMWMYLSACERMYLRVNEAENMWNVSRSRAVAGKGKTEACAAATAAGMHRPMPCLDVGLNQLDQPSGTYESVWTLASKILSLKTQCVRFSTILWSNSILHTVLMLIFWCPTGSHICLKITKIPGRSTFWATADTRRHNMAASLQTNLLFQYKCLLLTNESKAVNYF